MALHFHPKIVEVINLGDDLLAGEQTTAELRQAVQELMDIHEFQEERFLHFCQGKKHTPSIQELIEETEEAFTSRREALTYLCELSSPPAPDETSEALESLLRTSQRLTKYSEELDEADTDIRFSPFPLLHDFIQASLNVCGNHESLEAIEERLGPVILWVQDVEQDWSEERELFSVLDELESEFEGILDEVKEGVGAVFVYLDEKITQDLLAGLHLLGEASQRLAVFMAKAQGTVQDKSEHSPYRDIESLVLRQEKHGPEDPKTKEARARVQQLLNAQQSQLNGFSELPVDSDEFLAIFEELEKALGQEYDALEKGELEALCEASMTYWSLQEELAEHLESSSPDLSEVTALGEYRKVLLGVYYRQTPNRFLAALTGTLFESLETTYQNETEPEARQALELCLAAFEQADLYLQNRDRFHLVESKRLLKSGALKVIALEHEQQRQLAISQERAKVPCTKCGHRNEQGLSSCSECGSKLAVAFQEEEQTSLSITDGGEDTPQHLRQLLDLAARLETSQTSAQEVKATVEPLLKRARALKTQVSKATKGEELEQFQSGLSAYETGLQKLLEQAESVDFNALASAVASLKEGASQLRQFLPNAE